MFFELGEMQGNVLGVICNPVPQIENIDSRIFFKCVIRETANETDQYIEDYKQVIEIGYNI